MCRRRAQSWRTNTTPQPPIPFWTISAIRKKTQTAFASSAELIKEFFGAVGIGVTVTAKEADTVDDYVWPDFDVASGRDYDMAMWGWSAPVQLNPDALVRLGMSDYEQGDLNLGGLSNAEYDALCKAYLATTNVAERAETSKDIPRYWLCA